MKKTLFAALVLASVCACTPRTLTVATYNVGTFHKYTDNSTPMVADMMAEIGAEVLSLNELDSMTRRRGPVFQLEAFAEEMGRASGTGKWNFNFSRAMAYDGGAYGIGTAVSPKYKVTGTFDLILPREDGSEQRALSVIETKEFVFASTHLDHMSSNARCSQAKVITDWMKERYGDSRKIVILAGDFNAGPSSDVIAQLRRDWNIISAQEPSFPSRNPDSCIDYIMVLANKAEYEVEATAVLSSFRSGNAEDASDHLPTYARIVLK